MAKRILRLVLTACGATTWVAGPASAASFVAMLTAFCGEAIPPPAARALAATMAGMLP
jgi:hypothetical protein